MHIRYMTTWVRMVWEKHRTNIQTLVEIWSHDYGGKKITLKMLVLVHISISYVNNHGMKVSKSSLIPEKHLLSHTQNFMFRSNSLKNPRQDFQEISRGFSWLWVNLMFPVTSSPLQCAENIKMWWADSHYFSLPSLCPLKDEYFFIYGQSVVVSPFDTLRSRH